MEQKPVSVASLQDRSAPVLSIPPLLQRSWVAVGQAGQVYLQLLRSPAGEKPQACTY